MAITAINSISVTNNRNNAIQFGARRRGGNDNQREGSVNYNKASGMVTIPTALFLALASQSINVQAQNQSGYDFDNTDNIELLAMNTPQVSRTSSSTQVRRGDIPEIMKSSRAKSVYIKDFVMDGKKWTMYYHNARYTSDPNAVTQVYFIPSDYRVIKDRYDSEVNSPPKMEGFVVHESPSNHDETFGAVKIHEVTCNKDGSNKKSIRREIRLPDEVANEIIGLYLKEGNLRLLDHLQNNYTIVQTPKLMTPVIQSLDYDD